MARQAGFSEKESRTLAKANNDIDSGQTGPYGAAAMRTTFHAFGSVAGAGMAQALAAKSARELGSRLHYYQDSFSHAGFGPSAGHLLAGHRPDKTSADPVKAVKMALGTFSILGKHASDQGKNGFGAPDQGLLTALAKADADVTEYDPNTKKLKVEIEDPAKAAEFVEEAKKAGVKVTVRTK